MDNITSENNQITPISQRYELFILSISLISIVNIFIMMLNIYEESKNAINIINLMLSIIFLSDFIYRFLNSRSKSFYFFRDLGWLDLLGSLPLKQARAFRLVRILRSIRLSRRYGVKKMVQEFQENKAESILMVVVVFIILLLQIGSAVIVFVESKSPVANIKTGEDAIWWAYVTITTVGYGDRFPVTSTGRFLGFLILTAGVGLFGVFTGYLANSFLAPRKKYSKPATEDNTNSDYIKTQIESIKKSIDKLEKAL